MKIVGTGLIFLAGFILGVVLFHARAVKADVSSSHISVASEFMSGKAVRNDIVNGTVVGFSCVPDATSPSGLTGNGVCYIATQWGN